MRKKKKNGSLVSFFIKYFSASGIVFVALTLRLLLDNITKQGPYLLFIAAIMLCTWLYGIGAGVYATALSAVLLDFFLLRADNSLFILDKGILIMFHIFLIISLVISYFIHRMARALEQSEIQKHNILRNEKLFRLMVQEIKDYAIYFLNPDGYILNWNEGAEKITGYERGEVLEKHFSMFYAQEEILDKTPWKQLDIARNEGRFKTETWRTKKDGQKYWANFEISAVTDDEGKLEGFVTIIQDMTERRLQEQQKDNFISIASHELKTPITSIKAFTQLMLKHFKDMDDKKSVNYLERMESQINKMTSLIESLLDVSRLSQGRLEYNEDVFRFDDLINDIIDEVQLTASKHKIVKQGKVNNLVLADKYRVGQVITNLLTNAIKYSPGADKVIVKTSVEKGGVLVAVTDFGIGIPAEQKEYIFQRFYRAQGNKRESYPGLGLGLFISAEIMKRHGGKMWFESTEGKGSTFYFLLPITLKEKIIKEGLRKLANGK